MFDFCVIVPAYNEEKNIFRTLQSLEVFFSTNEFFLQQKIAVVVVDDGSEDNTMSQLEKYKLLNSPSFTLFTPKHTTNRGKGAAIQTGIRSSEATQYGFLDADLSYDPKHLEEMVKKLRTADLVIGKREIHLRDQGYSRTRAIMSKTLRVFVRYITDIQHEDTQCGIKVFTNNVATDIVETIQQKKYSFDIELIIKSEKKGLRIETHPVQFLHSTTSNITLAQGIRYLIDIITIADTHSTINTKKIFIKFLSISFVVSMFLFGWTIFYGYFYGDEFTWLWFGSSVLAHPIEIFTKRMSTFYSPVMILFYGLMYVAVGTTTVWPYFFFGIFIHTLVSAIAGMLIYKMTSSRVAGWLGVLLTACAGGAFEPLVWVASNMHSIATLFILSSVYFYTNYLQQQKKLSLFFSTVFFLLALGTKETAIVLPALLVTICIYHYVHPTIRTAVSWTKTHIGYWLTILSVSLYYLYKQYQWQHASIWVTEGIFDIQLHSFLRIPYIFLDFFIPIGLLEKSNLMAAILGILAISMGLWILWKYSKIPIMWFGMGWIGISILPTLFFNINLVWWEPLSSRYTYLPRIGMVCILAGIMAYHIRHNTSKKIIHINVAILLLFACFQIIFMFKKTQTEYPYVYNTGRTLVTQVSSLREKHIEHVYISPDRPFSNNIADMIGAMKIYAEIPEENIIFATSTEQIETFKNNLHDFEAVLYWDHKRETYQIILGTK